LILQNYLKIKKKKKSFRKIKRNKLKTDVKAGTRHIADLFTTDKEIVAMRSIFTKVIFIN